MTNGPDGSMEWVNLDHLLAFERVWNTAHRIRTET